MSPLIECVPNISEGRDQAVIEKIVAAVRETNGCKLLHVTSDADHNRTVITFIGVPAAVENAAVALTKQAAAHIDLTGHTGVHPRMGAVDVIPFIPLRDASFAGCVRLSRRVGGHIWREAGVPVFLYEKSASAPHRANLAAVRKGGFEGMFDKIQTPDWRPDFGDAVHPAAGVTACGARGLLVAFNVNLDTDDAAVARAIAGVIRQSNGGLPGVKALGLLMHSRKTAQVSLNMTDTDKTSLRTAMEAIRSEAKRRGVGVTGSEIVGLASRRALDACAGYDLMLEGFDESRQVLENYR